MAASDLRDPPHLVLRRPDLVDQLQLDTSDMMPTHLWFCMIILLITHVQILHVSIKDNKKNGCTMNTYIDIHHALGMSCVPSTCGAFTPTLWLHLDSHLCSPEARGMICRRWLWSKWSKSCVSHCFSKTCTNVPSFRASIPVAVSPSSGDSNAMVYSFLGSVFYHLEHVGTTMNQPFLQKVSTLSACFPW